MKKKQSASPQPVLTLETLENLCHAEGLSVFTVKPDRLKALYQYLEHLMKWNKVMNLVGPNRWDLVLSSLIADSAFLATFLNDVKPSDVTECWDLGSGAGLPGIPLRILWNKGQYTLVEAREKRALFMRTFLATCPLKNVDVFQGRAETFMPLRPKADIIVSRAFMPVEKMLEFVGPYLALKGVCVFLTLYEAPPFFEANDGNKWLCVAQERYTADGQQRFFWALTPCNK